MVEIDTQNWIEKLPEVIGEIVKARNLNVTALSEKSGYYRSYLSKLLKGYKKFGLADLTAVSEMLDIPEEDLIREAKKNCLPGTLLSPSLN